VIFFLLLGLTSHYSEASMSELGELPYLGSLKVKRYQLSNGLKILILEDHTSPTFAYQTWFNVGSRDEVAGLTGLAHLFEHMMFKATKNHKDGEFDKMLESAGAEGLNAFTSRDFTAYVQSLPSTQLELIVSLEAERMVNLIVDEDALNKEREVVQNERRFRNENNPDGKLDEELYEMAFQKHSYHWPIIGYEEDLKRAKKEQCEAFYKSHYAPNNATVIMVGDVDPKKAVKIIEKYYGDLGSSKINRKAVSVDRPQTKERTTTVSIKTPVEKILLGYHVVDAKHEDFVALEVLRNLLGVGKSSRLHKSLVDGGIASSVDLMNQEQKDPGLFEISVNLQKGKTGKQALSAIDLEIGKVIAGKVQSTDLKRAVSLYRFSLFKDQASHYSKAQFLGFYETVAGDFKRGLEIVTSMDKVSKEELARIAKKYFKKTNRNVVFGKPLSKKG